MKTLYKFVAFRLYQIQIQFAYHLVKNLVLYQLKGQRLIVFYGEILKLLNICLYFHDLLRTLPHFFHQVKILAQKSFQADHLRHACSMYQHSLNKLLALQFRNLYKQFLHYLEKTLVLIQYHYHLLKIYCWLHHSP